MNVFALLDQTARRLPAHGAVFLGTEQRLSWVQLHARALRLAGALRQRHRAGDRIVLWSENRPEYFELLFGTWAAEMVAVPINYKLHPKETAQIVEDAGAAAAFISPQLAAGLQIACPQVVIDSDAYHALFAASPIAAPVTSPETLAWLFYTSGTTGRSKGAMLTHRNLLAA